MAKDDVGDLDDEELELIRKMRRANKAEQETEIWLRDGDKEARLPYGQGRNWLKKYGFLLGDDDLAPEPEPEEEKPTGTRFAGRKIS